MTQRWREMDSNHRSPVADSIFRDPPFERSGPPLPRERRSVPPKTKGRSVARDNGAHGGRGTEGSNPSPSSRESDANRRDGYQGELGVPIPRRSYCRPSCSYSRRDDRASGGSPSRPAAHRRSRCRGTVRRPAALRCSASSRAASAATSAESIGGTNIIALIITRPGPRYRLWSISRIKGLTTARSPDGCQWQLTDRWRQFNSDRPRTTSACPRR